MTNIDAYTIAITLVTGKQHRAVINNKQAYKQEP